MMLSILAVDQKKVEQTGVTVTDIFPRSKRSAIMGRIRSKGSAPERTLRSLVHRMGYRFRLHAKDLPGTPDIVLPRHKKVIFMHSCFFHGHRTCKRASLPTTRRAFWAQKIRNNVARDVDACEKLRRMGWEYLIIWQCEIKNRLEEALRARVAEFLEGSDSKGSA